MSRWSTLDILIEKNLILYKGIGQGLHACYWKYVALSISVHVRMCICVCVGSICYFIVYSIDWSDVRFAV